MERDRPDRDRHRPEYRALAQATAELCGFFGYAPRASQLADVTQLLLACEELDRIVDAADARQRLIAQIYQEVLAPSALSTPMREAARSLAASLRPYTSADAIVWHLAQIEEATQRQRTQNARQFRQAVCDEGERFSALFLPIFFDAPPRFVAFFQAVGAPGNLIDKFLDAEDDHQNGELLLRPGLRHRAKLAALFARRMVPALRLGQERLALVRWALRLAKVQAEAKISLSVVGSR